VPILGICLGAQLMSLRSEEGSLPGLGWIEADVQKFPSQVDNVRFQVPHMGWDIVQPTRNSKLTSGWLPEARFYFVHSFYINCYKHEEVLFENSYGNSFHSAFEKENILGVQFHPEKSHKFGKQLLQNFIDLY
jgi:imidazole glycerol-phosphate synthase subunit HisH